MLTIDPRDTLVLAHEHVRRLRDEAAGDRARPAGSTRRAVAGSLRRAANRLDPAPRAALPQLSAAR